MTGRTRAFLIPLVASAFAVGLVMGAPLSASAYTYHSYWAGQTIENQTKSSGTRSMNGGRAWTPVINIQARITQSGVGSAQSYPLAEMTHATMSINSYCQWRDPELNWGNVTNEVDCWYRT